MPVAIRRASDRDSEALREIYNREVLRSLATLDLVPRTPEEQRAWVAAHSGAYPALVADCDGAVVGFSSLSPYRPRPGYSTSVEDSVYVAEGARGRGIGRRLLEAAVETAGLHGFHAIVGRIAAEQVASIRLHQSLGFQMVGVEREIGRKFGRFVDVAIVQLVLGERRLTPGLEVHRDGARPADPAHRQGEAATEEASMSPYASGTSPGASRR